MRISGNSWGFRTHHPKSRHVQLLDLVFPAGQDGDPMCTRLRRLGEKWFLMTNPQGISFQSTLAQKLGSGRGRIFLLVFPSAVEMPLRQWQSSLINILISTGFSSNLREIQSRSELWRGNPGRGFSGRNWEVTAVLKSCLTSASRDELVSRGPGCALGRAGKALLEICAESSNLIKLFFP